MHSRRSKTTSSAVAVVLVILLACLFASPSVAREGMGQVVIPKSESVEIAIALDKTRPQTPGIENAVRMAVKLTPLIHGFAVKLVTYDAPCNEPTGIASDISVAQSIVTADRFVAVIGHECSYGFGNIGHPIELRCQHAGPNALAVYENADIVTINGSATNACLPPIGPTVFNRTALADPAFDEWYYQYVKKLPSDKLWSARYTRAYGTQPPDFADLYYDAARVLLSQLVAVAQLNAGSLIIDRAALASAVRQTKGYPGVTCTVNIDPRTGNRMDDRHVPPLPCKGS